MEKTMTSSAMYTALRCFRWGVAGALLAIFFSVPLWLPSAIRWAQESDELQEIQDTINELTSKLNDIRQEKSTLSSEIRYLDNRVLLTEKEIEKTQYEMTIVEAQ